jgi:hypothetical protein
MVIGVTDILRVALSTLMAVVLVARVAVVIVHPFIHFYTRHDGRAVMATADIFRTSCIGYIFCMAIVTDSLMFYVGEDVAINQISTRRDGVANLLAIT